MVSPYRMIFSLEQRLALNRVDAWARQHTWLLLSFSLFPVRHPLHPPRTEGANMENRRRRRGRRWWNNRCQFQCKGLSFSFSFTTSYIYAHVRYSVYISCKGLSTTVLSIKPYDVSMVYRNNTGSTIRPQSYMQVASRMWERERKDKCSRRSDGGVLWHEAWLKVKGQVPS